MKALFVGGLGNMHYFQTYIESELDVDFVCCREVKQSDVDAHDKIIAYSFAIQYLSLLDLSGKKVTLLCPLMNDTIIKQWMLNAAYWWCRHFRYMDLIIVLGFLIAGSNVYTMSRWYHDFRNYLSKYPGVDKIRTISRNLEWEIVEGHLPVSEYGQPTKIINMRHVINFDKDFSL